MDENKSGYTPVHIAAKFGHSDILLELSMQPSVNMRQLSRKIGVTALHIAAFYGETEATRELLTHVPADIRSDHPENASVAIAKELANEYDLTPLHMASFSGGENAVRILLNHPGVKVNTPSYPSGYIPIHLSCLSGHVGVVGLLLSRTTAMLKETDAQGRTCLHIASSSGHFDMVQALIGQGAELEAVDNNGWYPIHYAAYAGFLDVVKQLVESGTSPNVETHAGKIPLWYAAEQGNYNVVQYLLRQQYSTEMLLGDRKFVFNLMVVGKNHKNKSIEDFIFVSPAPCYTAARLSAMYREAALKEKDRAAELLEIGNVCEEIAKDLIGIAVNLESPGRILNSLDKNNIGFIDTLIGNEQKIAISQYVVQQYLQEIWQGHLDLKAWQFILFFSSFVLLPPVWFYLSIPVDKGLNKVPVVKFMSYLTSHLYFMAFLTLVAAFPLDHSVRTSLMPFWYEVILWTWYGGLLLSQITNPGTKGGLSWVKYLLVLLGIFSAICHCIGLFLDTSWWSLLIYVRNLFFGYSLLFAAILILDFLSFHHLFGPWAIIIGELLLDVGKFVVVLCLFISGYSLLAASLNLPFGTPNDFPDDTNRTLAEKIEQDEEVVNPVLMFEILFFALFGLNKADDLIVSKYLQPWAVIVFRLTFASYLLLTVIVLVNLLIAMMSDTYQRIQQQSDIEWKYGLAKLIRNMQTTQVAPSPLNLFTTWIVLLHGWCVKDRREKALARKKFRQAMKEELFTKAPGMKFVVELKQEEKVTPTVIHALGNIKWGFSDGIRPIPVTQVQSKWDKEQLEKKNNRRKSGYHAEEVELTSKAVNWGQVIRRYLSVKGREAELKEFKEGESDVRGMMKSFIDIRNDGAHQAARIQAIKWTKIPNQAKEKVIQKWKAKAQGQ